MHKVVGSIIIEVVKAEQLVLLEVPIIEGRMTRLSDKRVDILFPDGNLGSAKRNDTILWNG